MKKALIELIFTTLCFLPVMTFGQENFSNDFGKVTQYEMSMTEYEKDEDAEAVIINEQGEYRFQGVYDRGLMLMMTKSVKIKILKPAGVEYAKFEIDCYVDDRKYESIEEIEAYTYNLVDGKLEKIKFDKKNMFEEKSGKNWITYKVALPDVRVGSVIELKYTIMSPFTFEMRPWHYQKKIPVVFSNLNYRAVPYYEYSYILKGVNKFDIFNHQVINNDINFGRLNYKEVVYNFGMKDLPAFRDEEFISSEKDYMISLKFQLSKYHSPYGGSEVIISTWPQLCNDLLKENEFGKYMNSGEKEGKKIVPALDITGVSSLEQARVITEHVKHTYNWNGNSRIFSSQKLSDFMKTKTGNAADINLYLVGLLRAAKLKANPVILSTRRHGRISKGHPFLNFFNYVIAELDIEGQKYYIDATESLLTFDELPERCIHVEGLVIQPKIEEWVATLQGGTAVTEKTIRAKVYPEGNKMDVNVEYIASSYDAYRYRSAYLGKEEDLNKYMRKEIEKDIKGEIKTENYRDLDKPFIFSFDIDYPIDGTSEKLFINPFCSLSIGENPFKQTSRVLAIDFIYKKGEKYNAEIEIPEGYKVSYLPSKTMDHEGGRMSIKYSSKQEGNKIIVSAEYNLKKNIYDAKEYIALKVSFGEMIKQFDDMIILEKDSM